MQVSASEILQKLENLVHKAKEKGADAADAVSVTSISEGLEVRNQKLEEVEYSNHQDLGLRVIVNGRQAMTSLSDDGVWNGDEIVDDLIARAKILPQDKYAVIAEHSKAPDIALDLFDETQISPDDLKETALALEDIALSHTGISQSLGASVSQNKMMVAMVNSYGFAASYQRSSFGKSVSVLGGKGGHMERDYAYDQKIYWQDLKNNQEIGDDAAKRTLRRLNPIIPKTGKYPIVFDPRIARRIVQSLAGAINGLSIIQKSSFLLDYMGKDILPNHLSLIDNPLLKKGLASRPFDGDGKLSQENAFVQNGILKSWVLDERSAKELGLASTASGARSTSAAPSPSTTNLALMGGDIPLADLMQQNSGGIYITDVMGMGTNMITGDYSQGASGFLINADGTLSQAINNFTIAGNLLDMLNNLQAADDMDMAYTIATPTFAVGELTVAGQN